MFKQTLKLILSSKKMTAKVIGIVAVMLCYISAFLAKKLGLDMPDDVLLEYATKAAAMVVALVATHIAGQSIADIGKGKAEAEAKAMMAMVAAKREAPPQFEAVPPDGV